jgi:hypothetical protein
MPCFAARNFGLTRQQRLREGIPVGRHLLEEFGGLAARYHVANLL